MLQRFAETKEQNILQVSLGKGQGDKAKRMLEEGNEKGDWIFLSNCHLSVGLLPELESIMDDIFKHNPNKKFRIFLSAVPVPTFPISLLQRSLKITQEPPRGIKNNMSRLYANMPENFTECLKDREYRKSVYGLCWFHTILIERKKFKTLGWNVSYSFNDSDYQVCEDTLANYMGRIIDGVHGETYDPNRKIPWHAIQKLIADANYGGRVTDDNDRRLITTYAKEIFNEDLVLPEKWRPKGTEGLNYSYPADEANLKSADQASAFIPDYFLELIQGHMEKDDLPQAYGQHTNAEITSQILDSIELLDSILSLQPAKTSQGGKSIEERTLEQITGLKELVPEQINVIQLKYKHRNDGNDPLTTVLVQEVSRYNVLLEIMQSTLVELELGIQGLKLINEVFEVMMSDLSNNKVPIMWS